MAIEPSRKCSLNAGRAVDQSPLEDNPFAFVRKLLLRAQLSHKPLALLLQGAGCFLAIYVCMAVGDWAGLSLLMAPFGASCVLAFALPDSPLAQPRSIIGGHTLSTAIGLLLLHTVGLHAWSAALGVALAIVCMQLTRTLHPPAGADPLVVMLGGMSWGFLWAPALLGSVLIVTAACAFHGLCRRRYPQSWL